MRVAASLVAVDTEFSILAAILVINLIPECTGWMSHLARQLSFFNPNEQFNDKSNQ